MLNMLTPRAQRQLHEPTALCPRTGKGDARPCTLVPFLERSHSNINTRIERRSTLLLWPVPTLTAALTSSPTSLTQWQGLPCPPRPRHHAPHGANPFPDPIRRPCQPIVALASALSVTPGGPARCYLCRSSPPSLLPTNIVCVPYSCALTMHSAHLPYELGTTRYAPQAGCVSISDMIVQKEKRIFYAYCTAAHVPH